MYIFQAFPKWQYHAEKPACVVATQEELEALGDGWVDNPALVIAASEPQTAEAAAPEPKKKGRKQ